MCLIIIFLLIIIFILLLLVNNNNNNNNPKFFNELKGYKHLDHRYGKNTQEYSIQEELVNTLKFFYQYCKHKNIKPIIMHGSLIGLYFNNDILPWDDDIDIILTGICIYKLNNYEDLNFIIEINPNYKNRSKKDKNNIIDARVINKNFGVFIDITFFYDYYSNGIRKLTSKDKHIYNYNDIYPLKESTLAGVDVYIPSNVEKCLIQEYGKNVLLPRYNNWIFINKKWIKLKK